jgi:hypothetical protein
MALEHIVGLLIQERDRIERAIEALQGAVKRRGRPPKNSVAAELPAPSVSLKRKGRPPMSAAEKLAASERMKSFWAAKRKTSKKR